MATQPSFKLTDNPAAVLREVLERHFPPERRAPGWSRKWDDLEKWCEDEVVDQPAIFDDGENADDGYVPPYSGPTGVADL